ncbi:MAG: hypothetical protein ACYC6N_28820, partial [Pirellulaceae bacterium]
PDLVVRPDLASIEQCVEQIMDLLARQGVIH